MICFRDTTFCSSDCTNKKCPRHFGEDDQKAANRWWRGVMQSNDVDDGAPIAWSDFSDGCKEYQKPEAK